MTFLQEGYFADGCFKEETRTKCPYLSSYIPDDNYDVTFYHDFSGVPVNDFCTGYLQTSESPIAIVRDPAIYTRDRKQLYA